MPEPSVVAAVSAENVRQHVEHITTRIPSRLAGSENGRRMAEYSAHALQDVGVVARVEELSALVSFPEPAELAVLHPRALSIPAHTLGHSVKTNGLTGALVYVGPGGFIQYEGKDVTGKVVLTELSYSPARHEKQRIATLKGATGAIMMNWGRPEDTAVPFGSVKPAWGNPTPETMQTEMPTIPCIGIARKPGLELKALCERSGVRVRLKTAVENCWRPVQITVGEMPAGETGDFVVVGGHQDSWFGEAATDNAAGNACMIELARVFNERRHELKRGLVFGFWTAHETGTMAGSTWFVDRNWDKLRKHAVAYLLIDQPACTGTTRWGTASNFELKRFHQAIEQRMLGGRPYFWKRMHKGGDASFFGLGVPMMYGMGAFTEAELEATADANLGWWHHSIECTRDKVDFAWMQEHLRLYAAYLWALCSATILPFDYSTVADEFHKRLSELARSPGATSIGLRGALDAAVSFRHAAGELDRLADQWRARYATEARLDPAWANLLNETFKRLSRILIPLQSTVCGTYGHDPYGYTPQSTMIPCLFRVTDLDRPGVSGEERAMLETQLVRDRNRVVDGLADASEVARRAVAALG